MKKNNVKWTLIVCLISVLIAAVFALFFMFLMKLMKGDVYQLSLQSVRQSQAVVDEIGKPVAAGYFVSGNINISGPDGEAAIAYSISGPKAEGQVFVEASRSKGLWNLETVIVEIKNTKTRISVVD